MRAFFLIASTVILAMATNTGVAPADDRPAPRAQKPNILFIMVDEMRWDVMSCAEHSIVKTPTYEMGRDAEQRKRGKEAARRR